MIDVFGDINILKYPLEEYYSKSMACRDWKSGLVFKSGDRTCAFTAREDGSCMVLDRAIFFMFPRSLMGRACHLEGCC